MNRNILNEDEMELSSSTTQWNINTVYNTSEELHVIDNTSSQSLGQPRFAIYIGHSQPAIIVKNMLQRLPHVHVFEPSGRPLLWQRDLQVCLPKGNAEIHPNILEESDLIKMSELANRMFPLKNPYRLLKGQGISIFNNKIPNSKLCLEGGNVKFWSHSGRQGAIVGISSVFFSMAAMERKGCFEPEFIDAQIQTQLTEDVDPIFLKAFDNDTRSNEEILADAQLLAAKWNLTKKQIARELEIDVSNLIILEHSLNNLYDTPKLHIDLDILIGLDNKVFLNNARLCKEAFDNWFLTNPEAQTYYNEIYTKLCSDSDSQIFERNRNLFEKHGFEVVGVPGFFDLGQEQGGQFLNGILFNRTDKTGKAILLSPSIVYNPMMFYPKDELSTSFRLCDGTYETHRLAQTFQKYMAEHKIKVIFVDCSGVRAGGLHCLTKESREGDLRQAIPQAIPCDLNLVNPVASQISVYVNKIFFNKHEKLVFVSEEGDIQEEINFSFQHAPGNLTVHILKPIRYRLLADGVTEIESQERLLLPGHPQSLDLRGVSFE